MILIEKLHLFAALFMTGAIWLVQIVQYPAFYLISKDYFAEYHQKHSDRISYVVAPVMLLELICTYWLFYEMGSKYLTYFVLTLLIFAATAFISVPLHNKLALGKNDKIIKRLIHTNWLRTILWSVKTVLLFNN